MKWSGSLKGLNMSDALWHVHKDQYSDLETRLHRFITAFIVFLDFQWDRPNLLLGGR